MLLQKTIVIKPKKYYLFLKGWNYKKPLQYSGGSVRSMQEPQIIAMIVADACRYDSMYPHIKKWMPYLYNNSTHFLQARSPGCWTLPSHASMFSGLLPHDHGATTQTRTVPDSFPTLAGLLKEKGYYSVMITANVATTDVFGLNRGFDEMHKIWRESPNNGDEWFYGIVGFLWRPRFRNRVFKSFIDRKLSEDVEGLRVFFRSYGKELLKMARKRVSDLLNQGKKIFLYINTYDTHFPYHTNEQFRLKSKGFKNKIGEFLTLMDIINNRHLTVENYRADPGWMQFMKLRQRQAVRRFSIHVDKFARWLRKRVPESTIIYCSDHGEQFGEENGLYHFSNVTEGGNRVPLIWSRAGQNHKITIEYPVSLRNIYNSILCEAGIDNRKNWHLTESPEKSLSVIEAYWYNAHGKTKEKYKRNQFAFVDEKKKYVFRNGSWFIVDIDKDDSITELGTAGVVNPIEESSLSSERKKELELEFNKFLQFEKEIPLS
ncbi:MAG: hypothetical protein DRP87_13955 [Spirochaetes bacterium]|nr:MAG: hypothetical protein DRP87_13955 [Spirochaetota bacterium]